MGEIAIKRIYEPPSRDDGLRILVDRIWPRGVSREAAHLTLWLKEIAPSAQLRQWFGHKPARWKEFQERYRAELDANRAAIEHLRALCKKGRVTFLYGARDTEHNQARVLVEYLRASGSHDRPARRITRSRSR